MNSREEWALIGGDIWNRMRTRWTTGYGCRRRIIYFEIYRFFGIIKRSSYTKRCHYDRGHDAHKVRGDVKWKKGGEERTKVRNDVYHTKYGYEYCNRGPTQWSSSSCRKIPMAWASACARANCLGDWWAGRPAGSRRRGVPTCGGSVQREYKFKTTKR